jgi:mono/diheme cytochrome c family protein
MVQILLSPVSSADQPRATAVPFVAGFDRFGRHGDIDEQIAGRMLITELSCTACHSSSDRQLMPKRGPVLNGVGSRLKADWMTSFLMSPSTSKHGTTMPDLLTSLPQDERRSAAGALTAFLSMLRQEFPEIKASGLNPVPMEFWNRGNADHGRQLYHQIGCVACHEPDASYEITAVKPSPLDEQLDQLDPDELKELGLSSAARRVNSVPHSQLASKYTLQSLTFFLLNPELTHPSGRMPNFRLLAVDAADLATWLLREAIQSPLPRSNDKLEIAGTNESSLIAEGRQLFNELRCASCHTIDGFSAAPSAGSLESLDLKTGRSCVLSESETKSEADSGESVQRRRGQPVVVLDPVQLAAIDAALELLRNGPAANETPVGEASELMMRLLQHNCYACHERGALGGVGRFRKPYFETVWQVDIGDEGRLPPALTGVGSRLTTAWMTNVLIGKGSLRPHMTIRMPVFPVSVTKPLPELFSTIDQEGRKGRNHTEVFAQAERKTLVEAGRQLIDTGCVQCHVFRGESLPGTVGVDLEGAEGRIQPEWLHDFLKDPGSLKPRTRMPTFFPGGISQNRDVLNGDTELQISAMVAYLQDLADQPLPEKIEQARAQNYELIPVDRPILLRTFMPIAGTHAIAVGFPQHVHFAFDAEQISLAQAWRGRFLDAEGTWFVRFAPPADPLGEQRITFPPGIAIARLENIASPWPADTAAATAKFSGYRLDEAGVPTILYRVGNYAVEDRTEPEELGGLRRRFSVSLGNGEQPQESKGSLWLRAHSGTTLKPISENRVVDASGLEVILKSPGPHGLVRKSGDVTEWIVPINMDSDAKDEVTIEVQYRW